MVPLAKNEHKNTEHYKLTKSHPKVLHTNDLFMKAALAIILSREHVEHIVLVYEIFDGEVQTSKQSNYGGNRSKHDHHTVDDLCKRDIVAHIEVPGVFVSTKFLPHLCLLHLFPALFPVSAYDA